ncbi:MAG: hypothetical protein IRZ16_19330 [Myxococcaceae bacterium]|nr:hypothetical protein [Myxococcaceae bacterium]
MAGKDPSLNDKLRQEPISEEEIDELREEGRGFEREPARTAAREPVEAHRRHSDHPERQAEGGHVRSAGHKGLLGHEGQDAAASAGTADESLTEQRRAAGRFETEGQPTQLEEDFGEINRNLHGSIHDSENKPSILDPDVEG